MNYFVEQIRKLNEKYGKVLTLEELEECKKNGELKFEIEENIDKYSYVNISNFPPSDNLLKTRYTKYKEGKYEEIDGKLNYFHRRTNHFTIGGKVSTHGAGDWSRRKYGYIFPAKSFIKKNRDKILSYRTEDTFMKGNTALEDAIVLCPIKEYEEVIKLNPNTLIIPVDSEYVVDDENNIDYVSRMLTIMNQYHFVIETWGLKSKEDEEKYINNIEIELGCKAPRPIHDTQLQGIEEDIADGRISDHDFRLYKDYYINIRKGYSLEELNDSKKFLEDEFFIDNGSSILQIFDVQEGSNKIIEKRSKENKGIEEYLGISLKEMYDGDMITTNAKRIKMIKEKMQEEGEENNPVAKEVFENCVKHFIRDYKTLSQCYDKRIDMEGFDFEKYSKEVDKSVLDLGINLEIMDEKNIFKQINEEQEIQKLLKEQGYVENPASNLSDRSLNRLKFLNDVLYKSAVKDYKEGNIEENEFGSIPISENFDKAFDTIGLVEKSIAKKIHEMENPEEIIEKLKEMGYTIYNKGKVDFDCKIEEMIEMAEKQAELEKQQETKDKSNAMDNLKASYEEEGIEPADLQNARNQMENTISQDKGQNQSTKEGEENDEH